MEEYAVEKRLYRATEHKFIGGVCAGLGEYFNIDPALVRVIAVLLLFAKGLGLLAYIVAWIIIPSRPPEYVAPKEENHDIRYSNWPKYLPGIALVAIGILLLVQEFWYWLSWREIFPGFLIIAGVVMLIYGVRQRGRQQADRVYQQHVNDSGGGTDNGGSTI
jgi:phage shock protein PspC (stress-responsive transcriptional regulator)